MKKISLFLSLFGLAVGLCACGSDHKNDGYCDAGFADGCRDGEYVYCHFEKKGSHGNIKAEATFEFNNITYVCNDEDVLVPRDYSCTGGVLNKDGKAVDNNVICLSDSSLISCEGEEVVYGYKICGGNSIMKCDLDDDGKYQVVKEDCGVMVCENYERDDKMYAGCFNSSDVQSGCDNVSIYGDCDAKSVLSFCTRKDSSKGKLIKLDCPARDQVCMKINDEYGYDCTTTCEDVTGRYTVHGTCEDGKLIYCNEDETTHKYIVSEWDCPNHTSGPLTCGFAGYQYNCI